MTLSDGEPRFGSRLIAATRPRRTAFQTAAPAVYRASTIFFDSLIEQRVASQGATAGLRHVSSYGTVGTPTTFALSDAIAQIEGYGHNCRAVVLPSGLNAIACVLQALLSAGDRLLMCDAVYGPARLYAVETLKRFGIATDFFAPDESLDAITGRLQTNTKVLYLENPSTQTFELLDVAAISAAMRTRGITTIVDNAWGSPMFSCPFDWGVDISLLPLTKYWSGHSDVVLGAIVMRDDTWDQVWPTIRATGPSTSGDDCSMVLRGLRTAEVRLLRHQQSAITLARWLEGQPGVARVLHPALESHPYHHLWQRDFKGASGLFSIELEPSGDPAIDDARVAAFCETRQYFRIGASWGGVESIALPMSLRDFRSVKPWKGGPVIRLSVGLENVEDLATDLEDALKATRHAASHFAK